MSKSNLHDLRAAILKGFTVFYETRHITNTIVQVLVTIISLQQCIDSSIQWKTEYFISSLEFQFIYRDERCVQVVVEVSVYNFLQMISI